MKSFNSITGILLISFALLKLVFSSPKLHKSENGREYLIETDLKYNWYQAYHECARRDSQLLIIDSAAKNTVIINLLKKVIGHSHNLWLGGNDEFSSSRDYKRPFTWSATGKKFTFTFWSDNNPDNDRSREHCVHIWASKPLYQWNDVECTNKMGFICEVNHYVESYKNDIKNKCDAVKKTTSALLTEFDQIKKEQQTDLNSKLQNIRSVRDTWKTQVMKVQSSTKASIEKILNEQEKSVKQLSEKMWREVKHVNEELQKSTADFNNRFGEKFTNGSFSFPMHIQNFVVIKQGV